MSEAFISATIVDKAGDELSFAAEFINGEMANKIHALQNSEEVIKCAAVEFINKYIRRSAPNIHESVKNGYFDDISVVVINIFKDGKIVSIVVNDDKFSLSNDAFKSLVLKIAKINNA